MTFLAILRHIFISRPPAAGIKLLWVSVTPETCHFWWSASFINGLLWYPKVPLWEGLYVGKSQEWQILKRSFIPTAGGQEVNISLKMTQKCHFWLSVTSLNGSSWYPKVPLWHGLYVGKWRVTDTQRTFNLAAGASQVEISHKWPKNDSQLSI